MLFEHGTYAVLTRPSADALAGQAAPVPREFGPVHVGSRAADFSVIDVGEADRWVVTGDHPDVLIHVAPDEHGGAAGTPDVAVGLHGRSKRHQDGAGLPLAHGEDARAGG
ncbi:hypothetical protein ACIP98_11485 [Streptomyces sp. NPDC088354]|uniref:hypothetical protein n=1 Tax=Streptomyces sp. NPDC088354 TaxID=3365856 RepID=UPI003822D2AA